jgi:hypothetical protein
MGRTTRGLIKSRTAATVIRAMRLVTEGAAAGIGAEAAGATANIIGISSELDTAVGERCSVLMAGNIAPVVYGGTVAQGDTLTSDAQGRAITTTTTGNRYVGTAEVAGVVGDIGTCIVAPGIL